MTRLTSTVALFAQAFASAVALHPADRSPDIVQGLVDHDVDDPVPVGVDGAIIR